MVGSKKTFYFKKWYTKKTVHIGRIQQPPALILNLLKLAVRPKIFPSP